MARVKAWLRVPELEEILGTDLDNTEELLLVLLLLMLRWLLTYLLSGPSLSLSTETRTQMIALKHVRPTYSANGPITLRPTNISVVCFSSAREGL